MAVSSFSGAGAAGGGEIAPINTLEKVYEAYSENGFFSYSPAGGVPAGKYAIKVEGSNVDFVEASGKGQASSGKNGLCYLTVEAGGAINATASKLGDTSVTTSYERKSLPKFVMEYELGDPAYSFTPYDSVSTKDGKTVAIYGANSYSRLYTSTNAGVTWKYENEDSIYTEANDVMTSSNIGTPQKIGEVQHFGDYIFALTPPVNTTGNGLFRSSDPAGKAGAWSHLQSSVTGWSMAEASGVPGRLLVGTSNGVFYSDNYFSSYTTASTPNGLAVYQIRESNTGIYAIQSSQFSSGGTGYIIKSTDNGQTWTNAYTSSTYRILSIANEPGTSTWVIVALDNNNYTYTGRTTDDFLNISFTSHATTTNYPWMQKVIWSTVYNGFVYALSDNNAGNLYLSTDSGQTKTLIRSVPNNGITALKETGGRLFTGAYNSINLFSTADGTNWNQSTSGWVNPWGVAYTGSKFFVANATTNMLEGTDLDSLSMRTVPAAFGAIVANGSLLMAKVSTGYSWYYSIDNGDTWTYGDSAGMYGSPMVVDGKFMRIDTSLRIWTSTDLLTWTQRATLTQPYRAIKKIGKIYFAYMGPSHSYGYAVSTDLSSWTYYNAGSSYSSLWGISYSEEDGLYHAMLGNGTPYSSFNLFSGNPYFDSSYGVGLIGPGYTTTGSPYSLASNTTTYVDGIEAGGVGWFYNGYAKPAIMPNTTPYPVGRYFMASINGQPLIGLTSSTYLNRANIGQGMVLSVNGSNYIYKFSYGKPASISIYQIKE